MVYLNGEGSESGMFVSKKMARKAQEKRRIMGGRDWVGIKTREAIIISAHLVRPTKDTTDVDRTDRLMEEITNALNKATEDEPDISIALAIDANTTLRRGYRTQTGEALMAPKKNHTPSTDDFFSSSTILV